MLDKKILLKKGSIFEIIAKDGLQLEAYTRNGVISKEYCSNLTNNASLSLNRNENYIFFQAFLKHFLRTYTCQSPSFYYRHSGNFSVSLRFDQTYSYQLGNVNVYDSMYSFCFLKIIFDDFNDIFLSFNY